MFILWKIWSGKMQILALSGRKQSGKTTCCHALNGYFMALAGIVRGQAAVDKNGKLWVTDIFGDKAFEGIFDYEYNTDGMKEFLKENLHDYVKIYSFADTLKQKVCIDVLGLSHGQCYGTDEEKNSLTHLKWEDMPGIIIPTKASEILCDIDGYGENPSMLEKAVPNIIVHDEGIMTAREVLQFVGTEIFRKMHSNVWVDALFRQIEKDAPLLAVISDCRFPNEVMAVKEIGGKVIRLTRTIKEDNHPSETALDRENFDWDIFDCVLDNQNMSTAEQAAALEEILHEWQWLDDYNVLQK